MKIVMIGEAATHRDEIQASLGFAADYVALPREAHESPRWDSQIEGADVLVAMRFKRSNAAEVPRFRLLHAPGAGLDGIDFGVLPAGCSVCNVFEHEVPMAEYTLAALLEHEVNLGAARDSFDSQRWSASYLGRKPRGELLGKTLMIVGFGRIGQAIAVRAQAFGMHVVAVSGRARNGRVDGPCAEACATATGGLAAARGLCRTLLPAQRRNPRLVRCRAVRRDAQGCRAGQRRPRRGGR